MKKLIALTVMLVALSTALTAQASSLRLAHSKPFSKMTRTEKIHYLKRQKFHDHSIIRFWHNHRDLASTHRWKAHVETHWAQTSLRVIQRNLRKLARPLVRASSNVISGLLCIHHYEGAWNDSGSPYWGGLQMDLSFQQTYGPEFLRRWGTADNWPIWAQLQAAVKAVAARGFNPWPNTARYCGLLP